MAILSAWNLIRIISIIHLTAAYFFLTSPVSITDHNTVQIVGASVQMPQVSSMNRPNDASAFIAVLLTFLGLVDLTAASLSDIVALEYWLPNVATRLTFFFALTAYTYLFKKGGLLYTGDDSVIKAGKHLCNSWTFAWSFFELVFWFWVYNNLRTERVNIAKKILAQREKEEEENAQ